MIECFANDQNYASVLDRSHRDLPSRSKCIVWGVIVVVSANEGDIAV
jgi:hypothetical protein